MAEHEVPGRITVRPGGTADLQSLARMDLSYTVDRYLRIERRGSGAEVSVSMDWRTGEPREAVYEHYAAEWLEAVLLRADLFLVVELDGKVAGLLIAVVPSWTDAAEITDLAVDRVARRHGAGSSLVLAASQWARERGLGALWAEPPADNAVAIDFYLRRGFRISAFCDRWNSNRGDRSGEATIFMHTELEADG